MNSKFVGPILVAAITLVPAAALAQVAQGSRCQSDSLDTTEAIGRLDWARQCGLLNNSSGASSWVNSVHALDAVSVPPGLIVWAKDYVEIDGSHAFSGHLENYNINYYYSWSRYEVTPMYTVFRETSGFTSNYWKWSNTTQRARPLYPTFESTPVPGTGTQLFPGGYVILDPPDPCLDSTSLNSTSLDSTSLDATGPDATGPDATRLIPICPLRASGTSSLLPRTVIDCNFYTDSGRTSVYTGPFYVTAYCESGCYAPDQSLRFSDGDLNIVDAMKAQRDDLVTLTSDATLDNLATQTSKVYSYTADIRDAKQVLYQITTASGGALSVTNEHPMVTSEGRLVKAEKLTAADQLLKADGTPDPITRIVKTDYFGKVYNIKPVSSERVANILIAQGYLVGSARFQNDDVNYMNRALLFRAIPDEVMPR
jgi:hypothetical protein